MKKALRIATLAAVAVTAILLSSKPARAGKVTTPPVVTKASTP